MTNLTELVDLYLAAWNEADLHRRAQTLSRVYTEKATYVDPLMRGEGLEGINAMIEGARGQFPGHHFERIGALDAHNDFLRFGWKLVSDSGTVAALGTDIGRLEEGRFSSVIGFLDPVPESVTPHS